MQVIVDGANVVGSRPDGWWRDRAGAARRLAAQLVTALERGALPAAWGPAPTVHLVLEGAAARATELPAHPALRVVLAPADGDATIAALAAALSRAVSAAGTAGPDAAEPGAAVLVVTADRALRERARATGAVTEGPGQLLRALDGPRL